MQRRKRRERMDDVLPTPGETRLEWRFGQLPIQGNKKAPAFVTPAPCVFFGMLLNRSEETSRTRGGRRM